MIPLITFPAESLLPIPGQARNAPETWKANGQPNVEHPDRKARASTRTRRLWQVVLGVCVALGLTESALAYWCYLPPLGNISASRALGLGLGLWCSWALLWLIAWPMVRRFPLGQDHWAGRLVLHMTASVVCVMLKILFDYPVIKYCYCPTPDKLTFVSFVTSALTGYFLRYTLLYWAMVGVSHAMDFYGKYRDGQLRAAQLEIGLARARLQLLKTQLQPHFLFNTLNAISALVHVDVEAADQTLARLGDLFRLALEDFAVQEAPLARELEIARCYLEIEQARLGTRLRIKWDIAPDINDALVPTFLLQPLIDNAVHHGIAPRMGPGCIEIRAHRSRSELHLEVLDDGVGLPAEMMIESGMGLANTQARLVHMYGTGQRFAIGNRPQGGCVAKIVLPYHELAEECQASLREAQ